MWREYPYLGSRQTGNNCSIWWRYKKIQTFKQFLQAETLNADKNKSYYQWYNVMQLIAFHKQAIMKQQIYENMLASWSGMEYSPGIQFQTRLISMEEEKELTMRNQSEKKQKKRCRCGSAKHLRVSFEDFPVWLAIRKAKQLALRMGISQYEAKKSAEDAT